MTAQKVSDMGHSEGFRHDLRGQGAPPRRRLRSAVHAPGAEHAGVTIDERGVGGEKDEVIVFLRRVTGWCGEQFAGHAKVTAEPDAAAEGEEHVLAVRERFPVIGAGQRFCEKLCIAAAEDAGSGMDMDAEDAFVQAGIPLAGKIDNFGQFRHNNGQGVFFTDCKASRTAFFCP